jgi:hypothetical protein
VTPHKNVVAGYQVPVNISTVPISKTYNAIKFSVDSLKGKLGGEIAASDTAAFNHSIEKIGQAMIAYAVDPIGVGSDYYLRYGIGNRMDIGYKLAGKTSVFDIQYQFLGPVGNIKNITTERWYGSAAFQYGSSRISLPGWALPVKDALDFRFSAKNFMVPVIFSRSFGNEEEYGAIAFGVVYNYTRFHYTCPEVTVANFKDSQDIIRQKKIPSIDEKVGFSSYGGFVNMKLGFRWVYFHAGFAFYHQNYGDYRNVIGNDFGLKGWTFIPSAGIRFRIGKSQI